MPENQIQSFISIIALICLLTAAIFYIMSIVFAIKRLSSDNKKTSKLGIFFVVLATIGSVGSMLLYIGITWWIIAAIIVGDSILGVLLTEG